MAADLPTDLEVQIDPSKLNVTQDGKKIMRPDMLQALASFAQLAQLNRIRKQSEKVTGFVDLAESAGSAAAAGEALTILERSGYGQVEQLHVRSPNIDFRISVVVDGVRIFDKSYGEIRGVSWSSPEISAFAELDEDGDPTGYYIASVRDIFWYNSILVKVLNTGTVATTFSQLFLKYNTRRA